MPEFPNPSHPVRRAEDWLEELYQSLLSGKSLSLDLIQGALAQCPGDGDLLLLAGYYALVTKHLDLSLKYQKRFERRFGSDNCYYLLHALWLGEQRRWGQAYRIIKGYDLKYFSTPHDFGRFASFYWVSIRRRLESICREYERNGIAPEALPARRVSRIKEEFSEPLEEKKRCASASPSVADTEPNPEISLPFINLEIPIHFRLPSLKSLRWQGEAVSGEEGWYRLQLEHLRLSLLEGFDELTCLGQLRDIQTYWYQVEAVRKVLKQFHGRVLLADEVGLGKTIEAGMVLKEYLLRGMVRRVLILTPASMVGQWREEMASKFDLPFTTSHDSRLRSAPASFWAEPMVIASLAAARRAEHADLLAEQVYDLVIVDEAHHLKNRASQNWKLVNRLKKRFLLLLSATPVQNSLVELYNLLTLLKPGVFKTQKDFSSTYMTPGKPRTPANRGQLRDLMRDCMIRNTRALVDVHLPRRHALTLRLPPSPEEAWLYAELNRLVQIAYPEASTQQRLGLRHLLAAAGSSPAAAYAALSRFVLRQGPEMSWSVLAGRYGSLETGCKDQALLELLRKNPLEKKIIFVHHLASLERLRRSMSAQGFACVWLRGNMSGPEKDRAVDLFQREIPLLLSTESGGEGRNLQFCNTLINYDLPWNPMSIEQRIGRLHRIGQTREVFVFNLVASGTLEELILKILDEKINMFELVVGEIGAILGEWEEAEDFSELIFTIWMESAAEKRPAAFENLGERLVKARRQYEGVKQLDDELFGDELAP